ncbi:DUF4145 domain-containing protein [Klebsiella sp. GG_Kp171]|uniref:DUF4145 domain-containing protein n=1 Tax=Klebsiella sp. GG_Kp171 TaxID=3153482 RepID=UPI0032B4606C
MNLHDRLRIVLAPARQFWRAFSYLMQVHENHYTKRAGVAGIRARAHGFGAMVVILKGEEGCTLVRRVLMGSMADDCPRCGARKIRFDVNGFNFIKTHRLPTGRLFHQYEIYCVCAECTKTSIFNCYTLTAKQLEEHNINWERGVYNLKDYVQVNGPLSPADLKCGEPPEFLPVVINERYKEGLKCLSIGCYNAAATMFRLCLDYATKERTPNSDSGPNSTIRRSLGLRMKWLFDNQLLPLELKDLAECVKDDGNDGAHEGLLDKDAAEDLEDFTYLFLERLYSEPQRLADAKARREKRKNRGLD